MTTIQVFPYVEPDKQVTARYRAGNLEEHLRAFLATNNAHGFLEVEFEDNCVVGSLINSIMRAPFILLNQFDDYQKKLRELVPSLNRNQIGLVIARSLGYHCEDQMWRFYTKNNVLSSSKIPNSRVRIEIVRKNSVKRAEEMGGTVAKFRAAIINARRVTDEEFKVLDPIYHEWFRHYLTQECCSKEEVTRSSFQLMKDSSGKRRKETQDDKHSVLLDTLWLCYGYVSSYHVKRAHERYGYITNLRYSEHVGR